MATPLRPVPDPPPARAVAYVRVSTPGQAETGISLEAQEAKLRALASLNDYVLADLICDEGESGRSLRRPGAQAVLRMVRRGEVDAVLVARLDRLTRSVRDLVDLIELCNRKGVALVSAQESLNTGTAAGRMVVHMLGVVAQWQREDISERTTQALAHIRAQGRRAGTVPYGYVADEDGRLTEDPAEQDDLAELRRLRATGLSLRATAAELTAQGRRNRNGGPWHATSVRRLEQAR